jgi:hypothetical protein
MNRDKSGNTKESANPTLASVKREMAQPRCSKSARTEETNYQVTKRAKKPFPKA